MLEFGLGVLGEALAMAVVAASGVWLLRSEPGALTSLLGGFRGDPWPRGVQEDDDFAWDWRAPSLTASQQDADSTEDDAPSERSSDAPEVRELAHGIAPVEPVHDRGTHLIRH
jgi:hypothetical protein